MKELHLLGKLVKIDECPLLLKSNPDENWEKDWQVMAGKWHREDGWLIGAERGNKGGILFSRTSYDCDVIFSFTMKTVPVMSFLFLFISLFIIFTNIPDAIRAFGEIFSSAFGIKSISGGVTGAVVAQSIKQGMAKGSLSHEAGAGTSPISHAASNTKSPVEQGFLGIFEVFADTIVMCTVTALVVLIARDKVSFSDPYNGMAVTQSSYGVFLGEAAHHIIAVSTLFFAFAALICWSYYGICCVEYLTDDKRFSSLYLVLYCIFIAVGAVIRPEFMWELTDFFTCALIFINVPVLFSLRGEVIAETEKYFPER